MPKAQPLRGLSRPPFDAVAKFSLSAHSKHQQSIAWLLVCDARMRRHPHTHLPYHATNFANSGRMFTLLPGGGNLQSSNFSTMKQDRFRADKPSLLDCCYLVKTLVITQKTPLTLFARQETNLKRRWSQWGALTPTSFRACHGTLRYRGGTFQAMRAFDNLTHSLICEWICSAKHHLGY